MPARTRGDEGQRTSLPTVGLSSTLRTCLLALAGGHDIPSIRHAHGAQRGSGISVAGSARPRAEAGSPAVGERQRSSCGALVQRLS